MTDNSHEYLLDFPRKLRAVCTDAPDVLARVQCDALMKSSDLWAIWSLSRLTAARNVVEIGSHKGGSMLWLAYCWRPTQITCIDPYEGMSGPAHETMAALMDSIGFARERLGVAATLLRKKSHEAAGEFADESVDVLLVDGYHDYVFVSDDLADYWPRLRRGGLLVLHDYSNFHPDHLGVVRAVNEWYVEPQVTLLLPSKVAFVRKPQ